MKRLLFLLVLLLLLAVDHVQAGEPYADRFYTNKLFSALNLAENGLKREVFNFAIRGWEKLSLSGKLHNSGIVTIADYSQSSNKKRLYVIDLKNMKLLFNTYVAHGRNTGDEFASSFSNKEGSLKTSLGFYVTENPIIGSHTGFSLMINGVEKGINDNAEKRAIIMHAADYATEDFIRKYGRLGRSLGCPAVPPEFNQLIIEAIKGGTCLFLYNPDKKYLSSSSLLN